MKNCLISFFVLALIVTACDRGPKHINDIKDAQVSTLSTGSEDRYQLVTDPATGLSGLAEKDGSIFIPVKYSNIVPCFNTNKSNDLFMTCTSEGLCGVCNTSGKKVIDNKFLEINFFQETSACDTMPYFYVSTQKQHHYKYTIRSGDKQHVLKDDGYDFLHGAISVEGKELVPCKFSQLSYEGNGFFMVKTPNDAQDNYFWGLYKDGKEVIPCKYNSLAVSRSANGAVADIFDGSLQHIWHAFDLTDNASKTVLYCDRPSVTVSDHFIIYRERPGRGAYKAAVIDFKGNVIIPAEKYTGISEFDGFFICDTGSHHILLNSKQQEVFNEKYYWLKYDSGVLIATATNLNYRGVIDMSGNWILPCAKYSEVVIKEGKILAYGSYKWLGPVKEVPLP